MHSKPATKQLLVVEAGEQHRQQIVDAAGGPDVAVTCVSTAADAMAALKDRTGRPPFDLVVLGLEFPDKHGFELVDEIREESALADMPLVLYTYKELSKKDELHLKRLAQTTVLKDVRSPERLLDEVSLFLHRRVEELPEAPARRSNGCTSRARCWPARRCSSSMTTSATSSP